MAKERRKVRFADAKEEKEFRMLEASTNREDRRLLASLEHLKEVVERAWQEGVMVPVAEVPDVYRRQFGIDNLWRVGVQGFGDVLVSLAGRDIWIVDVI